MTGTWVNITVNTEMENTLKLLGMLFYYIFTQFTADIRILLRFSVIIEGVETALEQHLVPVINLLFIWRMASQDLDKNIIYIYIKYTVWN